MVTFVKNIEMATEGKNNFLLNFVIFIGLAYLFILILKMISKEETAYSCPHCNSDIRFGDNKCNNCNASLNWPETI